MSWRTLVLIFVALMVCAQDEGAGVQQDSLSREAEAAIERGLAAEQAASYDQALGHYRDALSLAPGNSQAQQGQDRVLLHLGRTPIPVGDLGDHDPVAEQLAAIEVQVLLRRAEMAAAEGQFEIAREQLATAHAILPTSARPELAERIAAVEALIERFHVAEDQRRLGANRELRQIKQDIAVAQAQRYLEEEENELQARLRTIIDLKFRHHYELALGHARRLTTEYPGEPRVERLYSELIDLTHDQRELSIDERQRDLKKEVNNRIERSLIPAGFDGAPRFPGDWLTKRAQRTNVWRADVEMPEWEAQLRNQLKQRLAITFVDMDAIEALELVASRASLNLVIDPELRAAASPPITMPAADMQVESILNWLTRHMDTRWRIRNEAIVVGSESAEDAVIQAYDVTEFTFSPPNFEGQGLALFALDTSGSGGFGIFDGSPFGDDADNEGLAPEDLVDLIQMAVAPDEWDNPDYGIDIRQNYLLVRASPEIHRLITEFLRSQAAANNVLVRIDLRWLEIYDDFMEEIGVEWNDFQPVDVITNPITTQGYQRTEPEWGVALATQNQLPASSQTTFPQTNLTTGFRYRYSRVLGNTPVNLNMINLTLTAIEQKRKGRVLDAIELTTLNGVGASAYFGDQIAYISDYDVAGSGNYDPVIDVVNIGRAIDIRPLVSADRKYVSLDLRPVTASVTFFTENITAQRNFSNLPIQVPGVPGGPIVVPGVPVPPPIATSNYPLELPNLDVKSAGTRVMIPDRGGILVGGFGRNSQQHAETQVPFLGHIPFLGRLFGKRGRYITKSKIYLTVTTRIILYDEEEALQ